MSNNKGFMTIATSIGVYLGLLKIFNHMLFLSMIKVSVFISLSLLILQIIISSIQNYKKNDSPKGINMFSK